MNPKCQVCIRVAMVVLIVFVIVQVILAVIKGVYTKDIVMADVMQALLKLALDNEEFIRIERLFDMVALGISMVTVVGILCTLAVLLSARLCNKAMGGCITKFFIVWSFLVFFTVAIIFILVGTSLVVVKEEFNDVFIKE